MIGGKGQGARGGRFVGEMRGANSSDRGWRVVGAGGWGGRGREPGIRK